MTDHDAQVDPMTLALITELHTLEILLQRGCLNTAGLQYGYHFLAHPNQAMPGNASVVRERVLAQFITALAADTGMPESYWTDRTLVEVPDDCSGLEPGASG